MKTLTGIFALLLITLMTASAQTKSFNTNISFNAETRTLSCFVPENYDSTQSYRLMICLHGLGDNSTSYRDALINSFNWPALFPKTIFVCPDGGSDQNKDFYQPKGDQEIVAASLQFAKGKYNIDTQAVFLQGFSLGGRSALKYGLDNPTLFNGMLLNTPALQGLMDVQNDSIASIKYQYNNAKYLPVFISVGESDYTYVYQVTALVKLLKMHHSPVQFASIPSMGHTLPSSSIMQKSAAFLYNKLVPHIDADLFELNAQQHFCNNNVQTTCLVRNNGDSVIHHLRITISAGNTSIAQNWNGNILPNHAAIIPLTISVPADGQYNLSVSISEVNNISLDENILNNKVEQNIDIATSASKTLVTQDFENSANEWFIHSSGSMFEWYIDDQVNHSGKKSIGSFNTALLFYSRNAIESFSSSSINIAGLVKKELNFDLAFTYYKYTPPYIATETTFADTLEILVSTDCGATYTSLFKKGGQQLATTADPIINALSIQACIFLPSNDEWRTEKIDLSAFATVENAIFKFNCISGMGGSLNLDNFSFGGSYVGMDEATDKIGQFSMYPNPANESVTITIPTNTTGEITILDITGKAVWQQTVSANNPPIELNNFHEGIYIVQLNFGGQTSIQKLLIRK